MVRDYTLRDLPYNALINAQNLARDFKTATGYALQSGREYLGGIEQEAKRIGSEQAIRNAFLNAVKNPKVQRTVGGMAVGGLAGSAIPVLGTIGGMIGGGLIGAMGPETFANANLATYNLSTDKIARGEASLHDIQQGILENPVTATLDVLSLGGAKGVSKLSHATKSVRKPNLIESIIPSEGTKQVHRQITESLNKSKLMSNEIYKGLEDLRMEPLANRERLANYIMTNDATGMSGKEIKLGKNIVKSLRKAEDTITGNQWVLAKEAKDNVVAQYIMNKLGNKYDELLHADVVSFLNDGKLTDRMVSIVSRSPKFLEDIDKQITLADSLYNNGKIAYLTQAIANSIDPTGQVVARDITKNAKDYFDTRRVIGRSTSEDLGKVLDDSLRFQMDRVYRAKEAQNLVDDLSGQLGRFVKKGDKLKANEVVISPKAIKAGIANYFADAQSKPLSSLLRGSKTIGNEGGIAIDKLHLKAMSNAIHQSPNMPLSSTLGMVKRNLLAQPHWIGLNRVGNVTNNIMSGIGFEDYADAIRLYKKAPDQLKQQTSYNHFISDPTSFGSTIGQSVLPGANKLLHSMDNLALSKDFKSYKTSFTKALEGLNEIATEPFFKIESRAELLDRFANFIHHAKEEAKATGKTLDQVINKANKDTKLYNKINEKVNKQLGDYLGRNYNIDPSIYNALQYSVPFYRFLSQTARTTGHQLADNGLAFQALALQPAKAGKDLSRQVVEQFGLDPKEFTGGFPYTVDATGQYRTTSIEPLPYATVLKNFADIASLNTEGGQLVNPFFNLVADVTSGERFGRPIKSINTEIMRSLGLPEKMIEPTAGDRWKYAGSRIADLLFAPYRATHTYVPEIVNAVAGGGMKSGLDTNPFLGVPTSYTRRGPLELVGRYAGLLTEPQMKAYKQTLKPSQLIKRAQKYKQKTLR